MNKIQKVRDYLESHWTWVKWLNPTLIVTVASPVALALTGGGHAPFLFYIPVLILWGPLLLVAQLMEFGHIYHWSASTILIQYLASPGLLYLIYTGIVGLTPRERRWTIFRGLLVIHLSFSFAIAAYGLYKRIW